MPDDTHPEPTSAEGAPRTGRWQGGAARTFAVLFLVSLALLGPFRKSIFPDPYVRLAKEQVAQARTDWTATGAAGAAGSVYSLDPSVRDAMWGTRVRGDDGFRGEIVVEGPAPDEEQVIVPVAGRTAAPNALMLRALDPEGKVLAEQTHPGSDFDIAVGRWDVRLPPGTARIELILVDGATGSGGWLGVGKPGSGAGSTAWLLTRPNLNTGYFLLHVMAVAGFLFIPGLALRRWSRFRAMPVSLLALPGMALMAMGGIALWLGGAIPGFAPSYGIANAVFAIFVLFRRAPNRGAEENRACVLYVALVIAVLAWSLVPLPVEQESFEGTNARGRMVASPPDCAIPYETGAYFLRAHEGVLKEHYIGGEWSVTSRGPLTAWMITTGLKVLGITPGDPAMIAPQAWPADREGYFVARIIGILTNALVVLAAPSAIAALGVGRRKGVWFGIGWIAISPVVFINTAFLWPKLLATFFGMLAVAEIGRRQRAWMTGAWLAMSYLSHPVGVLIAAPVCLWLGAMGWSGRQGFRDRALGCLRAAFPAGVWMIAFAAPWLLYKAFEGKSDVFLRYPLGDGHGYAAAKSLGSWLSCRWDNFIYSLVPGTLWHSKLLIGWARGNLSVPGHIVMNYQKVLPLGIGLAMAPVAVWQIFQRSPLLLCSFRRWVIAAGFVLMLIAWGYSHDALGRNCMEPVVVFVMIAASSSMVSVTALHRMLLALVAIEQLALLGFSFVGDPGFATSAARSPVPGQLIAACIAFLFLAWQVLRPAPPEFGSEAR